MANPNISRQDKVLKGLFVAATVLFALLIVPPLLLLPLVISNPGSGHPPAIIIPYLYLIFGFRFVAPVGAILALSAGWLAFSRDTTPRFRYSAVALGILFAAGSAYAWLHRFA